MNVWPTVVIVHRATIFYIDFDLLFFFFCTPQFNTIRNILGRLVGKMNFCFGWHHHHMRTCLRVCVCMTHGHMCKGSFFFFASSHSLWSAFRFSVSAVRLCVWANRCVCVHAREWVYARLRVSEQLVSLGPIESSVCIRLTTDIHAYNSFAVKSVSHSSIGTHAHISIHRYTHTHIQQTTDIRLTHNTKQQATIAKEMGKGSNEQKKKKVWNTTENQ